MKCARPQDCSAWPNSVFASCPFFGSGQGVRLPALVAGGPAPARARGGGGGGARGRLGGGRPFFLAGGGGRGDPPVGGRPRGGARGRGGWCGRGRRGRHAR